MPAFYSKLRDIAREENAHINENLEARARSSVYIAEGVSAIVLAIFVIYEAIFWFLTGAPDFRPIYFIPVAVVAAMGPASAIALKHGAYECIGKSLLIIMHVAMILLAFWLDCFTEVSLCVVYVPLFIAVGPVMLLRSIRTELLINTSALLAYFAAAAAGITPISADHAVLTGIVAYVFSIFSLIAVSTMRYTIAKTSRNLARQESVALVERQQRLALQEALNAAQQANVAKTTFLNTVSHDIRTPMNAIMGMSMRAASNIDDPEVVKDSLKRIDNSSAQLLGYISNILDITDRSSSRLGFTTSWFSLSELAGELEAKYHEQLQAKQVVFTTCLKVTDDEVSADRGRLSQVLTVLLDNAITYTPKGGTIEFAVVEASRLSKDRVRYVFRVKDTGIGMPREFLDKVFDPFAHELKEGQAGLPSLGLGLPLVKTMVDASGGSVHIKSEEGAGTEVTVLLPLGVISSEPEVDRAGDGSTPSGEQTILPAALASDELSVVQEYAGAHILVVDDNALNREVACDLLSDLGFVCDVAQNGEEAVEKFSNSMPGFYLAILMDILMPGVDGMQATSIIRKLSRTDAKTVLIVALSANMESVDAERAMAAGMNAFLNKPFQVEEFLRVLSR